MSDLDPETRRALLSDEPVVPVGERVWPWAVSSAVVVLIGVLSATTHAQVPLLSLVDFGIHEFGHLLFSWAGWTVNIAAGSFLQVAVPLALGVYFGFVRGEMWAGAPLFAWAGASLRNVAVYIADAPYQRLELWGGDNVVHDWAQLLAGRQMQYADAIAWFANAVGWLLIATALAFALAPLVERLRARG